jgi:transcriptional antiterminator RfaH
VVNTHPNKERTAIEHLGRQRIETYCPLIRKGRRNPRGNTTELRPLFPSYVFVRIDGSRAEWRPILSTIGVRRLISFGDCVGRIDHGFIESLRARERDGVIVAPPHPYRIGQDIRMVSGPFDGLIAKILEINDHQRLVVLMDLLQQTVRVQVSADSVTAA